MSGKFRSFSDQSKVKWGRESSPSDNVAAHNDLLVGCSQRSAGALESIAANIDRIVSLVTVERTGKEKALRKVKRLERELAKAKAAA